MAATTLRVALESYHSGTTAVSLGEVRISTDGVVTANSAKWATVDDVTHAGGKFVLTPQNRVGT